MVSNVKHTFTQIASTKKYITKKFLIQYGVPFYLYQSTGNITKGLQIYPITQRHVSKTRVLT